MRVASVVVAAVGTLVLAALLVLAPGVVVAAASAQHPTLREIEPLVMCPTCGTTLERSDSPAADRMRAYIRQRIEQGWTRQQVLDGLVAEYGGDQAVLARPRAHGRGLVAWLAPVGVVLLAVVGGGLTLRRWRRDDWRQAPAGSSSSSAS